MPPKDEPPLFALPVAPAAPTTRPLPPLVVVVELSAGRPELLIEPPDVVRPPVVLMDAPPEF